MIKYVRFFQLPTAQRIPAFKACCFWDAKAEESSFEYKYYDGKNFEEIFTFFCDAQEAFNKYIRKGKMIMGELIAKDEVEERFFEDDLIFKCELNETDVLINIKPLNLFEKDKLFNLETNKKIKVYNL